MKINSSIIKINSDFALHTYMSVVSKEGVHNLRVQDQELQYREGDNWINAFKVSPNDNNALKKLPNGYFVQAFLISNDASNALIKREDGYFVQKETGSVSSKDLEAINERLTNEIYSVNRTLNLLSEKILQLGSSLTKVQEFTIYKNNVDNIVLAANVASLINLNDHVILNTRALIINQSTKIKAQLKIEEHGVETMSIILNEDELQQYDFDNAYAIKIYTKGNVKIYLNITYI